MAAESVGRRRPGGPDWLLREVSLTLTPGDRIALSGESGSGKTLLARSLALLDPVDEGRILWKGQPISPRQTPSFRRHVVYLSQRPWLGEGTVEDALRRVWTLRSADGTRYDSERIFCWVDQLGREKSFLRLPLRDLSGGEAQIVALLRALQLDPDVLLLDEATAAMDSATQRAAESLVRQWLEHRPDGRALLWIGHDREQNARLADRVVALAAGRIADDQ